MNIFLKRMDGTDLEPTVNIRCGAGEAAEELGGKTHQMYTRSVGIMIYKFNLKRKKLYINTGNISGQGN